MLSGDADLLEIIGLSRRVTFTAVALSCLPGLPLGALLAVGRFPGRMAAVTVVNALMGLPPVVVGPAVYLLLSGAGPPGLLQLRYTPSAMFIPQTISVPRSEEHTSEPQHRSVTSYPGLRLKKQ